MCRKYMPMLQSHKVAVVPAADHTSSLDHLGLTEPWPSPVAHGQNLPETQGAAAEELQLLSVVLAECGRTRPLVMTSSAEARWLLTYAEN